jgi:hypothetical protein
MTFIHSDPLAHRDAKFINVLYCTPVGTLLQMDKAHLNHFLARTKLVCRWLEGLLKLVDKLDGKGE